jgi:hypothetical protein
MSIYGSDGDSVSIVNPDGKFEGRMTLSVVQALIRTEDDKGYSIER